jgi:hypothetical protein
MYDNIDMLLTKNNAPNTDFLKEVPQYLTNVVTHGISQYGEYLTGYLDSLKVSVSDSRIKIYGNSICKYYLGDNFKTLNKGDTKTAIAKISDCLHVPIDLANVTRIDFSNNFIMQNDVNDYYKYLGQLAYYNRLEQSNGLYYNNGDKQVLFYGKVREQKDKRQPIPELYKNKNVLRYEMRYKKHLRQQLNRPEITAGLLYDEAFYRDLVKRWQNEYLKISKINLKMTQLKPTGSTKELIENAATILFLEFGQPQLLSLIKEWQHSGEITKKQAQDHRNKIKGLSKLSPGSPDDDLINELDKKIKQAAKYC